MSSTTVAEFASELKKSPDTLLEQLRSAGVAKSAPNDALSESDKQKLLGYLQASHGTASAERKKITLTKKSTSEIKQADASGKARTIQVEVRKKRTFIKRDDEVAAPEAPAPVAAPAAAPGLDDAELARREEEARRQAELIRRQEEDLAEKRRQREEAEKRDAEARAAAERAAQESKSASADDQADAAAHAQAQAEARAAAKAQAEAESKARSDEEAVRAADLDSRRRKALAEAEAIRAMMAAPAKKVLVAKKPEEAKPVAKAADGVRPGAKGTLHKPAVGTGRPAPSAAPAGPGAGKEIKSAKLSSSCCGPHRRSCRPGWESPSSWRDHRPSWTTAWPT